MDFIANFWAAYVPVGIVLAAAIVELAVGRRERRAPRSLPNQLDRAPDNVIVLYPRSSSLFRPRRASVPRATPARVIVLREARQRRSVAPAEIVTRRRPA